MWAHRRVLAAGHEPGLGQPATQTLPMTTGTRCTKCESTPTHRMQPVGWVRAPERDPKGNGADQQAMQARCVRARTDCVHACMCCSLPHLDERGAPLGAQHHLRGQAKHVHELSKALQATPSNTHTASVRSAQVHAARRKGLRLYAWGASLPLAVPGMQTVRVGKQACSKLESTHNCMRA